MSITMMAGGEGRTSPGAQVGGEIRRVRQAQEISQDELARRLGLTQAAVSQWESGRRTPSIDDLVEVARVLDHDVRDFLPASRPSGSVPKLLRAEVAQLDFGSMATMVEAFIGEAERSNPIEAELQIERSGNPIRLAQQLLARSGVVDPPVPVEKLCRLVGARVIAWKFVDALSGLVMLLDDGAVIGVNKDHPPVRRRFTMAHELGHLLLGHVDQFHLDLQSRPEDGDPPGYDAVLEREANEFAANLLMPAATVRSRHRDERGVALLAREFEVSELSMRYRLANLGLR
jgi:Zn-dependent peptidase ImmA (M78 family)/transcriptional regulator with XRE-family HTH domain